MQVNSLLIKPPGAYVAVESVLSLYQWIKELEELYGGRVE